MRSFLLANFHHGLKWAVVTNLSSTVGTITEIHESFATALGAVKTLKSIDVEADIMKITPDGGLTAEY
jgi:hypothetical protein